MIGDAVFLSAWVQAAAAVAVGVLTFFLVRFTKDYVAEMRRTNELQIEANRITAATLALSQGQLLPRLIAHTRGRSVSGGAVQVPIDVTNLGGGPADDVVVVTDWGEGKLRNPLRAGEFDRCVLGISEDDWKKTFGRGDPKILAFRFRDASGDVHEQPVTEG